MSNKPIIYACSGCSNVARISHDIAENLDYNNVAEMFCVSGVIGEVPQIKEIAKSGREIIAIDGCDLGCTKACLDACDIKCSHYFKITDFGIEKRDKWQDSIADNSKALNAIYKALEAKGIK